MTTKSPDFAVAHATPGRIRLRALRPWSLAHELAVARMRHAAGVRRVTANPVTGGVLVHHDLPTTDGAVRELLGVGPERTARSMPFPRRAHEMENCAPSPGLQASALAPFLRKYGWDIFTTVLGLLGFEFPLAVQLMLRAWEVASVYRVLAAA